jgi:hypothetical protein
MKIRNRNLKSPTFHSNKFYLMLYVIDIRGLSLRETFSLSA